MNKKDADTHRKIIIDHFRNPNEAGRNAIKVRNDMLWMVSVFKKYGKIEVEYRDNKAGSVVPYINGKAMAADSICTAHKIGLEGIFKL